MENKRPKPVIPMTGLDIVIETLAALAVLFNIVLVAYAWTSLPEIIPSYFNTQGQIDGYGSKYSLITLVCFIAVMYIGLSVLTRFPHIYNYLVEITAQNAEVQYRLAKRMMRFLKLTLGLIFSYIQFATVSTALNQKLGLGIWFLPVSLMAMFGTVGYYLYRSVKAR